MRLTERFLIVGVLFLSFWIVIEHGPLALEQSIAADRIPTDVDASLRSIWQAMAARLRVGDVEGALDYIHAERQFLIRSRFLQLQGRLPQDFLEGKALESVYLEGDQALYRIRDRGPEGEVTYHIWFKKGQDGMWKIKDF